MFENKNWTRLSSHTTDDYVHWSEDDPIEKMKELRKLWDDILNTASASSFKKLLDEAYSAGRSDENDKHSGEDL